MLIVNSEVRSEKREVQKFRLFGGYQFACAFGELYASIAFDLVAVLQLAKGIDRRFDQVLGTGRAISLGENVGYADKLKTGADALTSGNTGARTGRNQHN
jgi:hypothetical protein